MLTILFINTKKNNVHVFVFLFQGYTRYRTKQQENLSVRKLEAQWA